MSLANTRTDPKQIHDELCRVLTVERENGTSVHVDVDYLLRRNSRMVSLVGIEAGGERAVWHFKMAGEWATISEFSRSVRAVDRETETLARGEQTEDALGEVEYAWVHPGYLTKLNSVTAEHINSVWQKKKYG